MDTEGHDAVEDDDASGAKDAHVRRRDVEGDSAHRDAYAGSRTSVGHRHHGEEQKQQKVRAGRAKTR